MGSAYQRRNNFPRVKYYENLLTYRVDGDLTNGDCSPLIEQLICLTNRFQVAVRLFSNRSQMTSKCGKNKKVAYEAQPSVSLMFLPHFDVLCDLLLNRRTATWNLFVLYNKKLKYTEKFTSNFATLTDTKITLT